MREDMIIWKFLWNRWKGILAGKKGESMVTSENEPTKV